MIAAVIAAIVVGSIPPALTAPSRVIWIDGDPATQAICRVTSPLRWECDGVSEQPALSGVEGPAVSVVAAPAPSAVEGPALSAVEGPALSAVEGSRAVVVIVGENGVAYQLAGAPGKPGKPGEPGEPGKNDRPAGAIKLWGRAVVVTPGAVSPDDVRDVTLTAWTPARSRSRLQSKRFAADKDATIDIVRIAGTTTFWVAGGDTDPDAFVTVAGKAIGSTRVAMASLSDGPPDVPVYVPAAMPFSLDGRVQSSKGEDADGASVELFQLLPTRADDPSSTDLASQSLVRAAATRSDQNGRFSFDRLSTGPFLISVFDGTRGRGTAVVRSFEPVVVRLVAPARASGRVLRNRLPVAGARIRFVPDVTALLSSTDATTLIAEERTTGIDGRFSFQLPPVAAGAVQITGPDGTSTRIAVSRPDASGDMDLGDIVLPDHRQLTARVMNADGCVLTATGPLNGLGLTTVRASVSGVLHIFDIPEAGQWALDAECDGRGRDVEPVLVEIAATGPPATIDVRIVK